MWGVTLYSFGLCIGLGIAVGVLLLRSRCQPTLETSGIPFETAIKAVMLVLVSGFIGARLLHAVYYPALFWANPLQFLATGGLVWYGGFFAGLLSLIGFALKQRFPVLLFTDLMAPSVALTLAFGRIGCLLAGCCYGSPCALPWAIQYPLTHATGGLLVHPTPLYESLGALVLIGVMFFGERFHLLKKPLRIGSGWATSVFLLGYGLLRFFIEGLRGDALLVGSLSASQWMSLGCALAGIVLLGKIDYSPKAK
jgi:phosphatidylglycerol---prolipoprotein diacylglyceryl transferase